MQQIESIEFLVRKNEENYLSYIRAYSNVESAEFFDSGNVVMSISAVDGISMINNFVSKAQVDEAGVDEILKKYRKAGRPLMWAVFPSAESFSFGNVLKKKGLMHYVDYALICYDFSDLGEKGPSVRGLEVRQVQDAETYEKWCELQALSFGYADSVKNIMIKEHCALFLDKNIPAKHYIGVLDGVPVATSTFFVADGVAGMYNATTLPEVRGKGVATAVVHYTMIEAKKAGCLFATAQATKQGLPVWEKIGWKASGQLNLYLKMYGKSTFKLPATLVKRTAQRAIRKIFY